MEINATTKEILMSIHWRSQKYTKFGISKYEYEKYWLTERKLRTIINNLIIEWFITNVWQEIFYKNCIKMRRNVYIATEKLLDLVKSFTKSIVDMNAKIIKWCNENPVQKLRDMGVFVAGNGRIWDKKSKTTVNKRNWAITNWKTGEKCNVFNYLRDRENCDTFYFFTHFIWENLKKILV